MSEEKPATRINPDGSQQSVPREELHLGDIILREDGKRVRLALTSTEMDLQRLASGAFQMRSDDKWYVATTYCGDTLYAPVEPPDSPFGHRSAQWIIPPMVLWVKVLTFQEVTDS